MGRQESLREFFETRGLSYHFEETQIGRLAHSVENREVPLLSLLLG